MNQANNSHNNNNNNKRSVVVKVTCEAKDETRKFVLEDRSSFAALRSKVETLFFPQQQQQQLALTLHYVDDEGDKVTISCDEELHHACCLLLNETSPLRLYVAISDAQAIMALPVELQQEQQHQQQPSLPPPSPTPVAPASENPFCEKEEAPSEVKEGCSRGRGRGRGRGEAWSHRRQEFETQLAELEKLGIDVSRRCPIRRLLHQFDGRVDLVAQHLQLNPVGPRHGSRPHPRRLHHHQQQDVVVVDAEMEAKVKLVEAKLPPAPRAMPQEWRNRRIAGLLARFDGDVDQVVQFIIAKRRGFGPRRLPEPQPTTAEVKKQKKEAEEEKANNSEEEREVQAALDSLQLGSDSDSDDAPAPAPSNAKCDGDKKLACASTQEWMALKRAWKEKKRAHRLEKRALKASWNAEKRAWKQLKREKFLAAKAMKKNNGGNSLPPATAAEEK